MEILSLLLKLLHFLYSLRDGIWNFTLTLKKPLQLNFAKYPARADSQQLKRVPMHIGIVLVEDDVSFKDLANLIIWCMLTGISYISIYDRSGMLTTDLGRITVYEVGVSI